MSVLSRLRYKRMSLTCTYELDPSTFVEATAFPEKGGVVVEVRYVGRRSPTKTYRMPGRKCGAGAAEAAARAYLTGARPVSRGAAGT